MHIYIYKHKDFIYLLGKTERKIHVALLVKMEKKNTLRERTVRSLISNEKNLQAETLFKKAF